MTVERRLLLTFSGRLDQTRLDELRQRLGLRGNVRLADQSAGAFGSREIPDHGSPERNTNSMALKLWRDGAGWAISIDVPTTMKVAGTEVPWWGDRAVSAATAMGLTLEERRTWQPGAAEPPNAYAAQADSAGPAPDATAALRLPEDEFPATAALRLPPAEPAPEPDTVAAEPEARDPLPVAEPDRFDSQPNHAATKSEWRDPLLTDEPDWFDSQPNHAATKSEWRDPLPTAEPDRFDSQPNHAATESEWRDPLLTNEPDWFDPGPDHAAGEPDLDLPISRTTREAHVFMDMTPCDCGDTRFERADALHPLGDGRFVRQYTGTCETCREPREFTFLLPDDAETPAGDLEFGGPLPSQLIDAGGWLWVADEYAAAVPPNPYLLDGAERDQVATWLASAIAALDEVRKFIPPGGAELPPTRLWTRLGLDMYARDPGRLRLDRLQATQDAYRDYLAELGYPTQAGPRWPTMNYGHSTL
ncbi:MULTISPECIES: hypothetical protein [unclassified Nocardia]|uniref:hypothetical protein n=1 Tax=unclassified Nocardia TaxID=2637762 RepID=UPI001CE47B2F|nr:MULTISPECIES: hypothetical protein [unclassified Nocardia]